MYDKWIKLKTEIKELTERLHEIEGDIWLKANEMGLLNPNGSKTFDVDGYKITITHKDNVKVDQAIAADYPYLFKPKYEFSKTMYKTFLDAEKKICDEAITITPAKPSFQVERI